MLNYDKDNLIPDYMRGGLQRYFEQGIPPGDFLMAVLENNLQEAFLRADDTNKNIIGDYVRWLYWEAPGNSWGSPEKVQAWIEKKVKEHHHENSV